MARLALLAGTAVCLLLSVCAPAGAAPLELVSVGSFQSPTYLTAPADDVKRVFVVERPGRIQVLDDGVKHEFLDISALVTCCDGERGMGSIAFPPDYASSGRFYVQYTAADPLGAVTVAEYRRSAGDPDAADPASGRILLSIPHDRRGNHDGGQLQFGPDGLLYIASGDGGAGGDPAGNGQNLTSDSPAVINGVNHDPRLGKILRIDPSTGSPYTVPAGNPFPAPARDVFAYGLRNPWRFSFDRQTGDLVVADVGQDGYEEVDLATAPDNGRGANYGWNLYEGLHTYPGGSPLSAPFPSGYTFPVLELSHSTDGVCSIIGGYVVRDPNLPELAGQYVYSDFCNTALRAATLQAGGATGDHATGLTLGSVSSFGEDACGRIYVLSLSGGVDRISNGSGSCTAPVMPFPGVPRVSIDDVAATEGGTASFTVRLSKASASTVTIDDATTAGSAVAPADYTATSGTLTFAPGETEKTVTVPVSGDTLDEDDETFSLDLSAPDGAIVQDGHGVATIADDDAPPSVSVADASVDEGDAGVSDLAFTATLSAASGKTVTAGYGTTDRTAHQPGDYAATSGTLTFAPGETTKTIHVAVSGDTTREADETLGVDLTGPVHATLARAHAMGTIVDDDTVPAIAVGDARVSEGTGAALVLALTLSEPGRRTASVDYATVDGTAHQPGDYAAAAGTVTFAPGETTKTVAVSVAGDGTDEDDETLGLVLSHPVHATIADGRATATILDDDAPPAVAIAGASRPEGDSGTSDAAFTVSLSTVSEKPVAVGVATADGTAQAGSDYVAVRRTVRFAPGETAHTVSVPVAGDRVPELDETFRLEVARTATGAVATVIDDDPAIGRVRGPRSARLGDLFCRHGARCRGIRLRVNYGGAGRGRWRFVVSDAAAATTRTAGHPRRVVLALRPVRMRKAASRTVVLRFARGGRATHRWRAVRRQVRPVLVATLDFTSAAGRHDRAARRVRLRR